MLKYIIVIVILFVKNNSAIQCKDENGENVDWFYVYKLPSLKSHYNISIYDGLAYYYITPEHVSTGWMVSENTIDEPESMVARTLAPMYTDHDQDLVKLIYNDQPPQPMSQEEILIKLLQEEEKRPTEDQNSYSGESQQNGENNAREGFRGQLLKFASFFRGPSIFAVGLRLTAKMEGPLKKLATRASETLGTQGTQKKRDTHSSERSTHETNSRVTYDYNEYDVKENGVNYRITQNIFEKGHTKGVVLADATTGFWLVHSVPHFPPIPDAANRVNYSYPGTGKRFGQTFLCVSLNTATLNDVAVQLKYNEPLVVHAYMPTHLQTQLNVLLEVMLNRTMIDKPWYHAQSFRSINNKKFVSYAKGARFYDDLYNYVADSLQSDLLVESWINGGGALDSQCSKKYHVSSVETLRWPECNPTSSHHDHSKWAVTTSRTIAPPAPKGRWVCIGDINREKSQEIRGGGTVCTNDINLWSAFRQLVVATQNCPAPASDTSNSKYQRH